MTQLQVYIFFIFFYNNSSLVCWLALFFFARAVIADHDLCVVFTLNCHFYPTTSVHPVPVLILIHPREIQVMWSLTVRQRNPKTTVINQGKSREILVYLVPGKKTQHNSDHKKH